MSQPTTKEVLRRALRLIGHMSEYAGQMALPDYALLNDVPREIRQALVLTRDENRQLRGKLARLTAERDRLRAEQKLGAERVLRHKSRATELAERCERLEGALREAYAAGRWLEGTGAELVHAVKNLDPDTEWQDITARANGLEAAIDASAHVFPEDDGPLLTPTPEPDAEPETPKKWKPKPESIHILDEGEWEECPDECSACSGEYCATHLTDPCDCDTLERHIGQDAEPDAEFCEGCGTCPACLARMERAPTLSDDEIVERARAKGEEFFICDGDHGERCETGSAIDALEAAIRHALRLARGGD